MSRRSSTARRPLGLLRGAVAAVLLPVTVLAACGDTDSGPEVTELVVPEGTAARLEQGEDVVVMPERLEFEVGEALVIRNEDVADASVGPYAVKAGQTLEVRFGAPGRFEGSCPLSENDRYEIVVTD